MKLAYVLSAWLLVASASPSMANGVPQCVTTIDRPPSSWSATEHAIPNGRCMNAAGVWGAGIVGPDGYCLTPESLVGSSAGSDPGSTTTVCTNGYNDI